MKAMLTQASARKKRNLRGMNASVLRLVSLQYCVFTNKNIEKHIFLSILFELLSTFLINGKSNE
jgi:hypothetical protein